MQAQHPHYLLYSEGTMGGDAPSWKFVLQAVGDEENFSAADTETESRTSRLELLAVVRGLEALAQPSRVTLITRSRYVRRGIRRELNHWRERRWRWERFGQLVPIRDSDLWQRVDRALQFHKVECCAWTNESDCRHKGKAPHRAAGRTCGRSSGWNVAAVLGGLRRNVLTPIQSLWRQPFTRAA